MTLEEVIKKLEDEIFKEEEWLYKEQQSEDTGFLNGLRFALKLLREKQ